MLSLIVLFRPDTPMYIFFPPICIGSLIATIGGSLLTRPVDESTLVSFYKTVRPFGWWRPIRLLADLSEEELSLKSESVSVALLNALLGMIAVTGYYLFPMYLVGHWYAHAFICLTVGLVATAILAKTWYRHLPACS